jgi:hypothetical protein
MKNIWQIFLTLFLNIENVTLRRSYILNPKSNWNKKGSKCKEEIDNFLKTHGSTFRKCDLYNLKYFFLQKTSFIIWRNREIFWLDLTEVLACLCTKPLALLSDPVDPKQFGSGYKRERILG